MEIKCLLRLSVQIFSILDLSWELIVYVYKYIKTCTKSNQVIYISNQTIQYKLSINQYIS